MSLSTFPGEVFADTAEFDAGIRLLIPRYDEMLAVIARTLPTNATTILELGSGTGELSRRVLDACPQAQLIAVDYSPRMITFAQAKLEALGYGDRITWVTADFGDWALGQQPLPQPQFDACVSSLAIHHLSDALKLALFQNIHTSLTPGGRFWNADPIVAASSTMATVYQSIREAWTMSQGTTREQVQTKLGTGDTHGHSSHDHLATLTVHLDLLQQAGFDQVEVPWIYYGMAVLGGFKFK